jgi:hypothetical protein
MVFNMPFQKGNKLARGGARPGSGPKPLALRELCGKAFHDRIPILAAIADDDSLPARDGISAIKVLADVGLPKQRQHSFGCDDAELPQAITVIMPPGFVAKD